MIRLSIVRILVRREIRRLQKNPSALVMLGLLTAIAFLMAIGTQQGSPDASEEPMGTVVVVVDRDSELVQRLQSRVPDGQDVRFELRERLLGRRGGLMGPRGWSIVEFRNADAGSRIRLHVHYMGATADSIRPFMDWFRRELRSEFDDRLWVDQVMMKRAEQSLSQKGIGAASFGDLMKSEVLGTTLLLMVQFFCSCHLLVSFTAEDREQRTLHALALTTARLSEIMVAKGVFHFSLTMCGCTAVAAILQPAVLVNPLFWITVVLGSVSTMCVGTCIATLAKNQAAAGMLALCYMMAGAILFFLATKFPVFAAVKALTVECYSFNLLYFTFRNPGLVVFLRVLIPMSLITLGWIYLARRCFYRFGWR